MNEIKVEFKRCDYFVFGRVVSMPEELRGTGKIISNDSYSIYSEAQPALYDRELTLRGGIKDRDNNYFGWNYETLVEAQLAISEFENLIKKWNTEHKEILNDVEKEYLNAVIKPFKNRIVCVKKESVSVYVKKDNTINECFYIRIFMRNDFGDTRYSLLDFPPFLRGQMYNGMDIDKEYTLNQLGLE